MAPEPVFLITTSPRQGLYYDLNLEGRNSASSFCHPEDKACSPGIGRWQCGKQAGQGSLGPVVAQAQKVRGNVDAQHPPTSDTHWEPQNGTYRRSGSRRQAGMDTSPPKNLKQRRQEQSSCLTFLPTLLSLQGALHWRRGSWPSGHCLDGERSTGATGARSQKENMTSGYLKPGPRPTEWSHLWQGPGGQKT